MAIELGANIGVQAGTSLFPELGGAVAGLAGIAAASAVAAIVIAVLRYTLKPDDESRIASVLRLRRILVVASFLAASGSFFAWIVTGTTSDAVPGLDYVRNWFG